MCKEKMTKPDVVLELTAEQITVLEPLFQARKGSGGIIIGSVGLSGETVALKYVERAVGIEIYELAYRKIGSLEEKQDDNS